jgi:general secretion pathway protein A
MVDFLHEFLIKQYAQNKNVVLIIDEAQNMPLRTLENLRMLSNLETSHDKVLQIILVGQPEFDNMLNTQELRQLKQRIAVSCRIQPLNQKESLAYIRYRLAKAALGNRQIFTPKAMKRIVKRSQGIPRLINIVCDNALVTGYAYQQKSILPKIINEVIKDLQLTKPKPFVAWKLGLWCLSGLCAALLLLYSVGHMFQEPVPSHKTYKKMDSVIHRGDNSDAPLGTPDRTKERQFDDLKKPEISKLSDLGRP